MAKRKKRSKNQSLLLILLALLIIGLSYIFIDYSKNYQKILKDEGNAVKEDDGGEKMDKEEGGGAVSLEYSNQIFIDLETKEVSLHFKNPSKSREKIVLKIYKEESGKQELIAKSNAIKPGYKVNKLSLEDIELSEGEFEGYMMAHYYDEKTNKEQTVDTKIDVKITVKEKEGK